MTATSARRGRTERASWPFRLAATVIVLLVVGAALTGVLLRRQATDAAYAQLSSNADLAATYVAEQVAGLSAIVDVWAIDAQLAELVVGADGPLAPAAFEDATTLVEAIRASRTGIATAFLTDADGMVLAAAPRNPEVIGLVFAERDWYRDVIRTGRSHVGSSYRAATATRSWRIAASAPVRDADGDLAGIVGATYETALFQDFADAYAAAHDGLLRLTDADGRVLAETGTPEPVDVLPADPLADRPLGRSEVEGRFVVRQAVGDTGWTVAIELPAGDALNDSNHLLVGLALGVLVVGLGVVGLTTVWYRSALAGRVSDRRMVEQTRTVNELSPVGVVEVDPDGVLVWANDRFADMLGRPAADLIGRPCADLLHADEPDGCPLAVLRDPSAQQGAETRRFAHADGSAVTALLRGTALHAGDGRVLGIVGVVTDISAQAAAAEALRAAQERAEVLWERAPIGVIEGTADGVITRVNEAMAAILGAEDASTLLGRSAAELADPDFQPAIAADVEKLRRGAGYVAERRYLRVDGTPIPVLVSTAALHDAEGNVARLAGFVIDMAELHEQREALIAAGREAGEATAFLQAVLDASPDVVVIEDVATGARTYTSAGGGEVVHPDDAGDLDRARSAAAALPDGEIATIDYRVEDREGAWRWVQRRLTPFSREAADGHATTVLSTIRDITELVEAEQRLSHAALHDHLTGLPNRVLLRDRLDVAIAHAGRSGREIAVLFCDLDGFKRVNDSAGHAAGDAVLVETAVRLRALLRPGDTVARVGGDEFVVLLDLAADEVSDPQSARDIAVDVATRICHVLAEPVAVDGRLHAITASVGITYADPASGPVLAEQLLRDADAAMYRAKLRGKDQVEVFDRSLRSDMVRRARVEQQLRAALDARAHGGAAVADAPLSLHTAFQPVFDAGSGRLVSLEALARLSDERGRRVDTEAAVAVAEDTGLIARLGSAVLEDALRALAAWRTGWPAMDGVTVAVNLSVRQVHRAELAEELLDSLQAHGLPPQALVLELTESVLLGAARSAISTLQRLRDAGVAIVIDDFGTGYASLRYLTSLPVSGVKIDRSFTAGLPGDATSTTIVRAIIGLAEDLGLSCTVEGVETLEQLLAMPDHVQVQGHLLSAAAPPAAIDIAELLGRGEGFRQALRT